MRQNSFIKFFRVFQIDLMSSISYHFGCCNVFKFFDETESVFFSFMLIEFKCVCYKKIDKNHREAQHFSNIKHHAFYTQRVRSSCVIRKGNAQGYVRGNVWCAENSPRKLEGEKSQGLGDLKYLFKNTSDIGCLAYPFFKCNC